MKNKYSLFLSTLSICLILSGCYVTTYPFKTVMHVSTLGLTYLAESYEESDKEFWKQWEANMANLTPEQKEQLRLSMLSSYVSTRSSYTPTPINQHTLINHLSNLKYTIIISSRILLVLVTQAKAIIEQ